MKIFEYHEYGPPEVLQISEKEKPMPKENEILIKIFATTVTNTECTFRKGRPYFSRLFTGIRKPKIKTLGEELAGVVESIGNNVKLFKPRDKVFGTAGPRFGANAEYITSQENGVLSIKPDNINFEESAASVDGFLTAMPFLRDTAKIKSGQKILINGASGSVGSSAVQVAKYFGASVTAVCSTSNVELVKSIGADKVVDYKKDDFIKSNETYDIIFDTVGNLRYPQIKKSLAQSGIFIQASITLSVFPFVLWTSIFSSKKVKIAATGLRPPSERVKDLVLLKELMEAEKIKPVIDRTYSFDQIVEAHRYVDTGRKRGNVVITVSNNTGTIII